MTRFAPLGETKSNNFSNSLPRNSAKSCTILWTLALWCWNKSTPIVLLCHTYIGTGFAEPLHHAESVKCKTLHITYITIHTMYIDKHATLDPLHFQHCAVLTNLVTYMKL